MSKATIFTRTADFLHKAVVVGLISYTGFHIYQVVSKAREFHQLEPPPNPTTTYLAQVAEKIKEHEENDARLDSLQMYRDEDYEKKQVQPYKPSKK